jgi:hypothetical protein
MHIDELIFDDLCKERGFKQFRNGHPDRYVALIKNKFIYIARVEIKSKNGTLSKSQKRMEKFSIFDFIPFFKVNSNQFNKFLNPIIFKKEAFKTKWKKSMEFFPFDEPTIYDRLSVISKQLKKLSKVIEKSIK